MPKIVRLCHHSILLVLPRAVTVHIIIARDDEYTTYVQLISLFSKCTSLLDTARKLCFLYGMCSSIQNLVPFWFVISTQVQVQQRSSINVYYRLKAQVVPVRDLPFLSPGSDLLKTIGITI
jgi:hypothetical protein